MKIFRQHSELSTWLASATAGDTGFVPTMGALHEGHISLVNEAVANNTTVVVSIFINPKQFNNPEDYAKYPVTEAEDLAMLKSSGCHAVYIPSVEDIYPENTTHIPLLLNHLESILEGPNRPGHFDGVVQVLHRLFSIVKPDRAYFGLKDFQQCKVVQALCKQYFPDIQLIFCPTLRESSGLAKSSRNRRLSSQGLVKAALIYKALKMVADAHGHMPLSSAIIQSERFLSAQDIRVEYLACADSDTFELSENWNAEGHNIVLIAAYIEHVRLIDNLQF